MFLNERDGHDTQSEELVQEEENWIIIINEDTVRNLHCILLLHTTHSSKVNCTLCVRKHTILGPALKHPVEKDQILSLLSSISLISLLRLPGLLTIRAKLSLISIPIRAAESIDDTDTDTFAKISGDTFTDNF